MDLGAVFPTTQIGIDPAVIRDFAQTAEDSVTTQWHVAFGQGIHACIGNVLARMEARHAAQALARYVERIDVVHDRPLRYLPSLIVRGLVELPLQVRRRGPDA